MPLSKRHPAAERIPLISSRLRSSVSSLSSSSSSSSSSSPPPPCRDVLEPVEHQSEIELDWNSMPELLVNSNGSRLILKRTGMT